MLKKVLPLLFVLTGCASGELFVYNQEGKTVGHCTSGFDWHPYGVQASTDWILHYCAQIALAACKEKHQGECTTSLPELVARDFSLPVPPQGEQWHKINARSAFFANEITETQYGYILAKIENDHTLAYQKAEADLAAGHLSTSEYEAKLRAADLAFNGK
ncbi:hypothetical protein ACFSJY_07755 [Thalassotalea euphylliae]|uniref:hypothetical protein n=1 Tax=Thalassotalea euphylliae TaxID=1655234 RepID=UPI0036451606